MHNQHSRKPASQPARWLGLDLARAFAIFGMVLVNFKIVMAGPEAEAGWLSKWVGLLEGRAAATFVILAGLGISLMMWRDGLPKEALQPNLLRLKLLKRAFILLLGGLVYTPLWPADILHFYGIYLLFAVCLLRTSSAVLLWTVLWVNLGFVLMLFLFDYEQGWDWQTLHYANFWTFRGLVRHLFFNGFHPVFPWVGFLIWGMWLGRQPLGQARTRRKIGLFAVAVAVSIETGSQLVLRTLQPTLDSSAFELATSLLGTAPMPPMPWYLLAAGGWATAFICLCLEISSLKCKNLFSPFISAGQMALTHYVAHVVIGMGLLDALGLIGSQTPEHAMVAGLLFFTGAVLFSWIWQKFQSRGPLELLIRKLTA